MKELARFNAVLLEADLGMGNKERLVVDTETGEIMGSWHIGDVMASFREGANAVCKELMVGREVNDNGMEYITISDYEKWMEEPRLLYGFWRNPIKSRKNKEPKHAGGKKPYLKLFLERIHKFKDADIGALVRAASSVDWGSGVLIDKRSKKPLDFRGLLHLLGYGSSATLAKRLSNLRQSGALTVDDQGRYVISRELLQKG
jgi:hypothetical protein